MSTLTNSTSQDLIASHRYDKLDIIFSVVQRGLGEEVIHVTKSRGVYVNLICPGRGTATSSILEMFGLGATEKDVILSFVKTDETHEVITAISKKLEFDKPGGGIAFAVPVQSIAGIKVLQYLTTASAEEGSTSWMREKAHMRLL